ncbi:MAG: polyprenyl synthetase family protein [Betaproteobacteria bacterium]|nr:polyprenyl synthetase family protein [Betaproteobacteria bacterium]
MVQVQSRTESALQRLLPETRAEPKRLHAAMRHAVLGGGKRVRPLLVHAAAETSQRPLMDADLSRLDMLACAVECIHVYSLVHDDLPCMDNDVMRRGKPTVHVEYDEATALLVGDSLQSLAFQLLSEQVAAPEASTRISLIQILAAAAGSRGMAGGQAIDLSSIGKKLSLPELESMNGCKTGALIRASVSMGARAFGRLTGEELVLLDNYARCIGLAFQVVDDVLDTESTSAMLGKTIGKDAVNNKPTYVNIMGLSRAKEFANELRAEAHRNLADFGVRARRLGELADFIVLRKF